MLFTWLRGGGGRGGGALDSGPLLSAGHVGVLARARGQQQVVTYGRGWMCGEWGSRDTAPARCGKPTASDLRTDLQPYPAGKDPK